MADIQQYLDNFLKLEEQESQDLLLTSGDSLHKRSNETYKLLDEQFIV
jgi:hypothetical protein